MKNRVCLITGSTSGIGKATALELAKMGATVVVHGRDPMRGQWAVKEIAETSGNPNVELVIANLSSFSQVKRLAAEIQKRYAKLDVLINNAGVFYSSRQYSAEGIEMQFAVNYLSHFLLTNLLLPMLQQSAPARIINVSSNAHYRGTIHFDDINLEKRYDGWTAYCQSKLANVIFTYELADRLNPKQVTANALHPGAVRTNIVGKHASLVYRLGWNLKKLTMPPVAEGAKTPVYLASSPAVEGISGLYFVERMPQRSSDISYDKALGRKLWELSEHLIRGV